MSWALRMRICRGKNMFIEPPRVCDSAAVAAVKQLCVLLAMLRICTRCLLVTRVAVGRQFRTFGRISLQKLMMLPLPCIHVAIRLCVLTFAVHHIVLPLPFRPPTCTGLHRSDVAPLQRPRLQRACRRQPQTQSCSGSIWHEHDAFRHISSATGRIASR